MKTGIIVSSLLLFAFFLEAQEPPAEEEAPASLFDFQLGDQEVELFLKGYWNLGLKFGLGAGRDTAGWWGGYYPSDISGGFEFYQSPDLEFRLLIDKRWLAQAVYTTASPANAFLLGYRGRPSETLDFVNIGTYPLTIRSAANTFILPNRQGMPAANVGVNFRDGWVQGLIQYEPRTEEVRFFTGSRETTRTRIAVHQWVPRRFFRLPGGPWPGLQFLAESGGVFRPVQAGEVIADNSAGLVEIPQLRANTYLVRWTGLVVGTDPITSLPLPSQTVDGNTWLILLRGNEYAPLELKNRYPLPADFSPKNTEVEVSFSRRGLPLNTPQGLSWSLDKEKELIVLEGPASAPGKDYPFYSQVPRLYEPGGQSLTGAQDLEITVTALKKEEGFFLGTGVQPDSIRIYRNDSVFTSFRFDASSGRLEILAPVLPTDRFEVRFLRQAPESGAPRLFLWQTGRWDLNADLNLQAALGLAWPIEEATYTTQENQAPGYGLGKILLQGASEKLLWEWELEGRLTVADATGERLWFEAGKEASTIFLETAILRPGALPPQDAGWGTDNPGNIVALSPSNRGRLRYRNYFDRDVFGNLILKPWGAPGISPGSYGDEGKTGPYLALGDSGNPTRSAVLEYEFDTTRRWVSAQIFVNKGAATDWTGLRRVRLRHRLEAPSPNLSAYLVMGSLGEDPDGSGQVRGSVIRDGFTHLGWTDPVASYQMLFPLPDAQPLSSGWQGRSWYAASVPSQVIARQIPLPSSTWTELSLDITPEEARRLAQTNSLQIVLVSNAASVQSGVYQFADLRWEGTSTYAKPEPPATLTPRVWQDAEALRIEAPQGPFTTRTILGSLTFQNYRYLRFRLRITTGPNPSQVRFKALDPGGKGLVWTASLVPSPAWREVEIDRENQEARVDGTLTGTVSWEDSAQPLTDWVIEYLDTPPFQAAVGSVRATEVRPRPEAATRGLLRYQEPGLTLETEARISTQAEIVWQGLWIQNLGPWSHHLRARLDYAELWRFGGGYRINLSWPFFRLAEIFQDTGERRQSLGLSLPFLGSWDLAASLAWTAWSSRQTLEFKSSGLIRELAPFLVPTLTLVWDQNKATGLEVDTLAQAWRWSTEKLYQWDTADVQRRLWSVQPRLVLNMQNIEVWADTTAELEQKPLDNTTLARSYKLGLGGRWSFTTEPLPWNLGWELTRRLLRENANQGTMDIDDSLTYWAQNLANDFSALAVYPASELTTPAERFWIPLANPSNQTYTGRLRADLRRAPLIGRWDLLLPLSASGSWETIQRILAQPLPATHQASVQLQWLSLNQLGRRAIEPFFLWYDQDEWSSLLRWDLNIGSAQESQIFQLLQHIVLGVDNLEFRLEHQWSWDVSRSWTWRGGSRLRWDIPVDVPLNIPYMRTPRDFQERLVLVFGVESIWSGPVLDRIPLQKIRIFPEAEWKFHPNGSLAGKWLSVLEWQGARALVGTQMSVELKWAF